MTQTDLSHRTGATTSRPARSRAFQVLIGLAALVVLLQGVWAGLFIREGQDFQPGWVEVHARGADLAIAIAAAASVVALVKLRSRPGLVTGSIVFTLLLVAESYLGGLVGEMPAVTAVHIPLALALMALGVWLPLHARRPRASRSRF